MKILTLKEVLVLGAFVLIAPLESDAKKTRLSDSTECSSCNLHWNKPWVKCYSSCYDEETDNHDHCAMICDKKIMPQFKACVQKTVSKDAQKNCKFEGYSFKVRRTGFE